MLKNQPKEKDPVKTELFIPFLCKNTG